MRLWQAAAADEMISFIKEYLSVNEVGLAGSLLEPETLDVYSDVDLKVSLSGNTAVNMKQFVAELNEHFCGVFGYQTMYNDDNDVLRICFDNGWRFDISFYYPQKPKPLLSETAPSAPPAPPTPPAPSTPPAPPAPSTRDDGFFDKIDSVVYEFWFISSMVLVKLGRGDYLIAAHLALELCRLTVVVQMLIRDEEKKTNIHRFGGREDVPVLRSLIPSAIHSDVPGDIPAQHSNLPYNNKNEIIRVLFHASGHMDKICADIQKDYIKRSDKLEAIYRALELAP